MNLPLTLACSACSDAIFSSRSWWAESFGPLFLGFAAEGVFFVAACSALKRPALRHRALEMAIAPGLVVLFTLVGAGTLLGLAVACAVLLVALIRSLVAHHAFPKPLAAARVAIIGVAAIVGLWRAWPTNRDTANLIDGAAYVTRFRLNEGWMIDELRRRPDALPALAFDLTNGEETHVQLHAVLGGPASDRQAACARLKLTQCP